VERPAAFKVRFIGPGGVYALSYNPDEPTDDKGEITVTIGDGSWLWIVDFLEKGERGWELGGMTDGGEPEWGDKFWFELRTDPTEPITYSGSLGVTRTDPRA
jgi:hypothetical protein